jgi:hypothetical protein
MDKVQKKTRFQIITHHRQNPLDFIDNNDDDDNSIFFSALTQ